jgi:curved DNA-binding protein CbpA
VLGVAPDADEDEIRRAYRERAKEVHPDAAGGDEEAFKRVTEAYERLVE